MTAQTASTSHERVRIMSAGVETGTNMLGIGNSAPLMAWRTVRTANDMRLVRPRRSYPSPAGSRSDETAPILCGGQGLAPGGPVLDTKGGEAHDASPLDEPRQRPTLPRRCQRSTIGPGGLNFRVRNGNGCGPSGDATGKRKRLAPQGRQAEYRDSRAQPDSVLAPRSGEIYTWSSRDRKSVV